MTAQTIVQGTPDMDVHQAADLMAQQQIRRLPVVENGHVVGMVALGDIAVQDQFANEAEEAFKVFLHLLHRRANRTFFGSKNSTTLDVVCAIFVV